MGHFFSSLFSSKPASTPEEEAQKNKDKDFEMFKYDGMQGLENENKWQGKNWSLNRSDWFNDSRYFDSNGNPMYDTNWQDEATRNAISHNHQLNIQQGGKNSSVGAFLNYTDQEGIMDSV